MRSISRIFCLFLPICNAAVFAMSVVIFPIIDTSAKIINIFLLPYLAAHYPANKATIAATAYGSELINE